MDSVFDALTNLYKIHLEVSVLSQISLQKCHGLNLSCCVLGSVCEICGCTAKNVTVSFTEEEWSEVIVDTRVDERTRRGSRQSCCVLIVFMLVIILIHWLFKKFSTKTK